MSKRCAIIFSFSVALWSFNTKAVHSFGIITDIELQSQQATSQKNKTAFQTFVTFEQNWSNESSKLIAQIRIYEYYKPESPTPALVHEVFPSEFHFEKNYKNHRITVGYQSILLTEGFNLIDNEIFHAKNNGLSVFTSQEKRYYTAPGIDYKLLGESLTFQVAVLKSERTERLSISQKSYILKSYPTFFEPDYRKESNDLDQLIKVLGTHGDFDWSVYYTRSFEKMATIQFNTLKNRFDSVSLPFYSYGIGISSLLGSSVLRFDFQKNLKRTYIDATNSQVKTDQDNANLSWEQTFGGKTRIGIILGHTHLEESFEIPQREKDITDVSLNASYKLNDRLNADVSVFERVGLQTSGFQLSLSTKILNNIEVKYGGEIYWTGANSRLPYLDDEDRLFIAFKATTF